MKQYQTLSIMMLGMMLFTSCGDTMKTEPLSSQPQKKDIIQSSLVGMWYTGNARELSRELDDYLNNVSEQKLDNIIALISPHAGYRYSGQTAAYGYKEVEGKQYDRVIVLGPSHGVYMNNMLSVPSETHYATPLGEIPIDTAFIKQLERFPWFKDFPATRNTEHSVEIQFPFLQDVLKDFKLVPIVVGQLDALTIKKVGQTLRSLIGDKTLVVASSDFTHYGQRFGYVPFKEDVPNNIKKLDMGAIDAIRKKDLDGFMAYCEKTGATICGRDPISIILDMLPEEAVVHLLSYTSSGHLTGDFNNPVSYASLAITGHWGEPARTKESSNAMTQETLLNEKDKQTLLALARGTLMYYLEHGKKPSPEDLGITITPAMQTEMGAFVTLHQNHQLRGCIGEIFPRRALYEAVIDHAINAGVNDMRFRPVKKDEVANLEFEISALTPPHSVPSWHDIELGRHGMVLSKQGRSAVFLPQVAPEQGWGIDETLTHLSMKAGLPADAWKEGADYTVFEALVFSE